MTEKTLTREELLHAYTRHEIEQYLHSPLSNEEWEYLVKREYINESLSKNSPLTSRDVANEVREMRRIYSQRGTKRGEAPHMLPEQETKNFTAYSRALSLLVAEEATKDTLVQNFRRSFLPNGLLSLDEVDEWVQEVAKAEGTPTWWLHDIPVPWMYIIDEIMGEDSPGVLPLKMEISAQKVLHFSRFRFLMYISPSSKDLQEVPTHFPGILEYLRKVSEDTALTYGWSESQATLFILSGSIPEINMVDYSIKPRGVPALPFIVLTVDPSLSPREVAEHYRLMRQQFMPNRHRSLSEKHLQLAIFAGGRPKQVTWQEKMDEWNSIHPEWEYKEAANFAHDCLQARRRLLHIK